jgi:hypothetical protein
MQSIFICEFFVVEFVVDLFEFIVFFAEGDDCVVEFVEVKHFAENFVHFDGLGGTRFLHILYAGEGVSHLLQTIVSAFYLGPQFLGLDLHLLFEGLSVLNHFLFGARDGG